MQFTCLPESYAPLGAPICYTVATARTDLEVRITDAAQRVVYGVKRFADITEATFDIAPCLRRALQFSPAAGSTAVLNGAERLPEVVVRAIDRTTGASVAAPLRRFVPSAGAVGRPALLTAMPRTRLIAPGECDELTLVTETPMSVNLKIEYGPHVVLERYALPTEGLWRFRLHTADFPQADRITVDAGECGTVVYSLTAPVEGSVRLAWRSRAGSLEHYTFPVEVSAGLEAKKVHACGPDGWVSRTASEWRRKLRSALERREVLEALAELVCSPEVWRFDRETYTPVEVLTERATVHNYGTLSSLDLVIRPKLNPLQPWN